MRQPDWIRRTVAYVAWIIAAVLIIWLFIIARSSLLAWLEITYVGESIRRAWQVKLFDKVYALFASSIGLALIAVTEPYFGKLADSEKLYRGIAKVLGPELLVITIFHGALLVLPDASTGTWQQWVIWSIEALLGLALSLYAYLMPRVRDQGES